MPEIRPLPMAREVLVDLSAALASRRELAIERALRLASRFSTPEMVDEVLLQAHLFLGFPLVLEALILWRRVLPAHRPYGSDESPEEWLARGEAVCRTVYAGNYEKLRSNVTTLHPDFDDWMVTGGYGRVIGRPGLDLATRELCIVALLAVLDAPRQLHSHLRGALHAGASAEEVSAALEVACRHLPRVRCEQIHRLAERVLGYGRPGPVTKAPSARR